MLTIEEMNDRKIERKVKLMSELTEKTYLENDNIPKEILNNLDNYPNFRNQSNLKMIDEIVKEDGSSIKVCILQDGKEMDCKTRSMMIEIKPSDEEQASLEIEQFNKGILKEISPYTIKVHKSKGNYDRIKHLPLAKVY